MAKIYLFPHRYYLLFRCLTGNDLLDILKTMKGSVTAMNNPDDQEKTLFQSNDDISAFRFRFTLESSAVINVTFGLPMIQSCEDYTHLPHSHGFYEIFFVVDQPAYLCVAEKELVVAPQSVCIVHPYEYHAFLPPKAPHKNGKIITISISIESLYQRRDDTELDMIAAFALLDQKHVIQGDGLHLQPLLEEIIWEQQEQKPGYVHIVSHLLKSYLYRLLRELLPNNAAVGKKSNVSRELLIERFYHTNYNKAPKVGQLAQILGISSRRTGQIIHEIYNCSFSEKLTKTRLEIAKHYLRYSDYSIGKIAADSGFPSQNFFFKVFRRHVGISPGKYRKIKKDTA